MPDFSELLNLGFRWCSTQEKKTVFCVEFKTTVRRGYRFLEERTYYNPGTECLLE
jgi:hypothetical protein